MITTTELSYPEHTLFGKYEPAILTFETYENNNTVILYRCTKTKTFKYEISKEDAIKLAKTILVAYKEL